MSKLNYEGNWTGLIILGKNYRENAGEKIYFDLEIKQEGKKIIGIAIDTKGFGINPDPAKIIGRIDKRGTIRFSKQYQSFHYRNTNGELIVDKSRLGHIITYNGNYNSVDGTFRGTWGFRTKYMLFKIIPLTKFLLGGTWGMERK